jgi:thioredoxin reductase (NADPH)
MYDLVIVGAGPAGLALAVEARAAGLDPSCTLVLEKSDRHNSTIRHMYPEHKLTTANYKGFAAECEGVLCVSDMTKSETMAYFERTIAEHGIRVQYGAEVHGLRRFDWTSRRGFRVESSRGSYDARVLAIAIGIFGRPTRPREYVLPASLKGRLLFDVSSVRIENEDVLVVGGGDTAAEYTESLQLAGNRVTLSYRKAEFSRLNDRNRPALALLEQQGAVRILRQSNIARVENEGGRPRVVFNEAAGEARVFDRVVYALGGTTPTGFLRMLGIGFDENGPLVDQAGETDVPGLFLLGDLVVGRVGGSINTAFNSAVNTMRRLAATHLRGRLTAPTRHPGAALCERRSA